MVIMALGFRQCSRLTTQSRVACLVCKDLTLDRQQRQPRKGRAGGGGGGEREENGVGCHRGGSKGTVQHQPCQLPGTQLPRLAPNPTATSCS